jgi:hypothetical protein
MGSIRHPFSVFIVIFLFVAAFYTAFTLSEPPSQPSAVAQNRRPKSSAVAQNRRTTASCVSRPNSGQLNPLGAKETITLEEVAGNTTVRLLRLPVNVAGSSGAKASITQRRELTFQNTSIKSAQQLLLKEPHYYNELVGFVELEGFQPIHDTLVCRYPKK